MYTEKQVLERKMLTNEVFMDLPLLTLIEKTQYAVETQWLFCQSVKKVMLIVFWDMKRPVIIDFLVKTGNFQ